MDAMGRIRVGIVGTGHNGAAHIQCHRNAALSEVVALCDRNRARLEETSRKFGIERLYTDDAIYDARDIDAISIHTGDQYHVEPFVRALAAGKHVFVEKPVGNDYEQLQRMADAVRKAPKHLKIATGFIKRFDRVFEYIYGLARQGSLGELYYLEGDYIHNLLYQARPENRDPVTGVNWYLDHEQPMIGGGCHALDLLRWFKRKEVVKVSGYANHVAFPQMKADDCQVALFQFEDGAVAKVAALYAPQCAMAPFYNLRVYGTRGTVERDQVALSTGPDDVHPEFKPAPGERTHGHPYDPEVIDWLRCIGSDLQPRASFFDGANSTMACIFAVKALRERRELDVPVLRPE
jgi:myo-inositol 2-dehydrogenase/D-chiro-inositol 1-dehydrogenase